MQFDAPLIAGRLIKRYKRFLADVILDSGEIITAHTPNTGSMLGCTEPGARVWLSRADNPKRKYAYTWELIEVRPGVLVGIHTGRPSRLVLEAIAAGTISELGGYDSILTEQRFGREASRIDLLLSRTRQPTHCYVEIKNVTAAADDGIALFPDAPSTRGTKHLRELMDVVARGQRAVLCFCVQRHDVYEVRPADGIDPRYGQALRAALAAGVEAIAYRATITATAIALRDKIPVVCPPL